MKILITDCFGRKAFDVFSVVNKYYGKKNIILAGFKNRAYKSLLMYGLQSMLLRKNSYEQFSLDLKVISDCFRNEKIVFLPIEEDTIALFIDFIEKEGSLNFRYLLPSKESFDTARNKYLLGGYCSIKNVLTPKCFEGLEFDDIKKNFVPLLVKPRVGTGARGHIRIDTPDELDILNSIVIDEYVIQERIDGGAAVNGAFFLCKDGKVLLSYCHQRLRTYPESGGVTVFSKCVDNPEIENIGKNLLSMLNWTGLAMIEFLWDDKRKKYTVIEVNPRLWGSILLDDFCGAHLLYNYIRIAQGESCFFSNIDKNTYVRWIFPYDIMNWIAKKGAIPGFWCFDKKTCYINLTNASFVRVFFLFVFTYFTIENARKIIEKWRK